MATATGKTRCLTCGKERATSTCSGCLEDFCLKHLVEHRQELNKQFDEIEVHRDVFQQTILQQINQSHKHPLIQQIDQWENDSIHKIKQIAEETKEILSKHTNEHINQIKEKLNQLTNQLRQSREEEDFTETNLQKWKEEIQLMTEQFNKPSNILIQQTSIPLINQIHVHIIPRKYI
jgi:hypothetical protein